MRNELELAPNLPVDTDSWPGNESFQAVAIMRQQEITGKTLFGAEECF